MKLNIDCKEYYNKIIFELETKQKDYCLIQISNEIELFSEILSDETGNDLDIYIEARYSNTKIPIECAQCNYENKNEIETIVEYILNCIKNI